MRSIRRFFDWFNRSDPARKAARSQLKNAKHGDREQYLTLAANYIDLAQTFLGSSFAESTEQRIDRAARLFYELWLNLRYTERVSDFEFMFAQALIESCSNDHQLTASEPLILRLRQLEPQSRFAFLAYTSGHWKQCWIALVMRVKRRTLHQILSQTRCKLCGISWESLSTDERDCLIAISSQLDSCPNVRACKSLSQRTGSYPRVMEIKAQWLELRSELVEVHMHYQLKQHEREQLLTKILDAIADGSMQRPALVDRMVNTVHFSRHSKIQVS
jgi:hypothetical protein